MIKYDYYKKMTVNFILFIKNGYLILELDDPRIKIIKKLM